MRASGSASRSTAGLHHFIDGWRANDKEIKNLLKETELWFVISANPDGYQFTFDHERLWRKNRASKTARPESGGDGVDPNRNFAEHWGYDNEGSADPADETYRGPSAGSEPETRAMAGLIDRIKPKFQSNLHSFGQWLLYPQGWQVGTLDADYPIYAALGGTDADPRHPGVQPGPVGGHALRHQRRDDRLRRHQRRHGRLHARARRGDAGSRIRVPRTTRS